ncbi:MAG: hypothetical protein M4579_002175 [Chaenotheca gracillima]|nr:MAG: hypothetical protein M4579_002175 [Chaenotheca gracillima]
MDPGDDDGGPRKRRRIQGDAGPYILRTLIDDVPLSEGESDDSLEIRCVDFWEGNLYIGTSAGEVLHYVRIPPDPADTSSTPSFILASRVKPTSSAEQEQPGVQQILLLPKVNKACVLCNGTVTFYSLPELSPAFGNKFVRNCNRIGGIDLDLENEEGGNSKGELLMTCLKNRIRLLRIDDDKPQPVRNIEFAGCLEAVRRGSVACVATASSYALLDVDHQQKIPLFPISSLEEPSAGTIGGQAEDLSSSELSHSRNASAARDLSGDRESASPGHGRSTSLGAFVGGLRRQQRSSRPTSQDRYGFDVPDSLAPQGTPTRSLSPGGPTTGAASPVQRAVTPDKPLPPPPPTEESEPARSSSQSTRPLSDPLRPHVLSPTSSEFLLITGTATSEAGVGIFVNLDGDVCRSTLEFERFPETLVLDGGMGDSKSRPDIPSSDEGYLLAVSERHTPSGVNKALEIQRWDIDAGESTPRKEWLEFPTRPEDSLVHTFGLQKCWSATEFQMTEVVEKLCLQRLRTSRRESSHHSPASEGSSDSRTKASLEQVSREIQLFESQSLPESEDDQKPRGEPLPADWEPKREKEEEQFAQRFGGLASHVVSFTGNKIWLVLKNPIVMKLDANLSAAEIVTAESSTQPVIDRQKVAQVLREIQNREPQTEAEFLSLGYIRQKASLLLFKSLMQDASEGVAPSVEERRAVEDTLIDSGLDPRVILLTIPALRDEVIEGRSGIWVYGGVRGVASRFLAPPNVADERLGTELLGLVWRFLAAWRRKKGFGSISDEREVFQTIDAALLRVLLKLDSRGQQDQSASTAARAELYALADQGVDCPDRAIELLEEHRRLFVLSRLYQSRKMFAEVLHTWKRLLESKQDDFDEFQNGEVKMRRYLCNNYLDHGLFEEYATWLARRNPRLGVQVFADDSSKVKFEPAEVVSMLEKKAPAAVKEYLEYMVFTKKLTKYVNNLIGYYLDDVLSKIESSDEARATLAQSYESYRALRPPRPTYRQFVADNAVDEDWWRNRLRLLELLGGSHGAASEYDIVAILKRIEPFEQELVPEMIILDGRQARHEQALRLLTHGLGDYDTAINYCLLGGSSIFHPTLGSIPKDAIPSNEEQAKLFSHLLTEFLRIEDISDRIEQTGNLLERFGGWFDVGYVLSIIPDMWSVDILSGFLISAFRRIVKEKSETMIAKSLSGAENLKETEKVINRYDELGPSIEAAE